MRDVILTHDDIFCKECKSNLISIKDLKNEVNDYYDIKEDGDYQYKLFCDFCKKDKYIDISVAFFTEKHVFFKGKENNCLFVYCKHKHEKTQIAYIFKGLPTEIPYFKKEGLFDKDKICEVFTTFHELNLTKENFHEFNLLIKNEGECNCEITWLDNIIN